MKKIFSLFFFFFISTAICTSGYFPPIVTGTREFKDKNGLIIATTYRYADGSVGLEDSLGEVIIIQSDSGIKDQCGDTKQPLRYLCEKCLYLKSFFDVLRIQRKGKNLGLENYSSHN